MSKAQVWGEVVDRKNEIGVEMEDGCRNNVIGDGMEEGNFLSGIGDKVFREKRMKTEAGMLMRNM